MTTAKPTPGGEKPAGTAPDTSQSTPPGTHRVKLTYDAGTHTSTVKIDDTELRGVRRVDVNMRQQDCELTIMLGEVDVEMQGVLANINARPGAAT
jgi:hypothetical protein